MAAYIRVINGSYRKNAVIDTVFPLIKQFQVSSNGDGGFVTVDGSAKFGPEYSKIRVKVDSMLSYSLVSESEYVGQGNAPVKSVQTVAAIPQETDEEITNRMREAFEVLEEMAKAATRGDVRALIVSGPPGVGKSYGIEQQVARANIAGKLGRSEQDRCEVISGACTPIALYKTLYKHRDAKHVVVFDDTDSVLYDDLSLNILKAALDTGKKRRVCWNAESRILREEDIPNSFDFQGAVIFITNISLEKVRGKIKDHVEALFSRCHYLAPMGENYTNRDILLRIKQVAHDSNLFAENDLTEEEGAEVVKFIEENQHRLRELSIRTLLKCADLRTIGDGNWQRIAKMTILK